METGEPAAVTAERRLTPDGQFMKGAREAEAMKHRASDSLGDWATNCVLSHVRRIRRCL
jgi:hypothetical protein